jgi:DNA-binding beta-propeller fold protein YncE
VAVRFGSGELRFELVEGWEQLPLGWSHPDVAGVSTDSEGNVYLFCRGEHPVIVYDRSGRVIESWGEGEFSYRVHGMSMHDDELFLVDDGAHSAGRYSLDGRLLQAIGPSGIPSGSGYDGSDVASVVRGTPPYNRPTKLAVAPNGDLYVSDGYGNSRVHRFGADGMLLHSWGEPGEGEGEFRLPHGVCADAEGRIFVADRQNDRIQIFDADGRYLSEWSDVQRPQDIFVDGDGLVFVGELVWQAGDYSFRRGPIVETEPARLSIFDLDGNLLLRWSDLDPTRPGYFIAPHGIWVDDEGSLYVAEVTDTFAVSKGLAPPDAHTFQKFARV